MGEYTPGPWPSPEYDNSDVSADKWFDVGCIARYVKSEADARLISAAPDLLEALERLLQHTGGGVVARDYDEEFEAAVSNARNAIAKATGG